MRVVEYILYMCIVSRIEFIVLFHCHLGFLVKNSGSLVAVEGHRQTPKKHTSKPLNWFLCVSYIQTALNLAISLLREYQYVCATLCVFKIGCKITKKIDVGKFIFFSLVILAADGCQIYFSSFSCSKKICF